MSLFHLFLIYLNSIYKLKLSVSKNQWLPIVMMESWVVRPMPRGAAFTFSYIDSFAQTVKHSTDVKYGVFFIAGIP